MRAIMFEYTLSSEFSRERECSYQVRSGFPEGEDYKMTFLFFRWDQTLFRRSKTLLMIRSVFSRVQTCLQKCKYAFIGSKRSFDIISRHVSVLNIVFLMYLYNLFDIWLMSIEDFIYKTIFANNSRYFHII